MLEGERLEGRRRRVGLRIDELELVALFHFERAFRLRAHAHPVDPGWELERAVGLDRDQETARVQRGHEFRVHLERGLAAGEHGKPARVFRGRPFAPDRVGERVRGGVFAAARAVGADEIRVADPPHGARAILFVPGPQIASGEAAEHRGTPGIHAFALQRVEDFLDLVHVRLLQGLAVYWYR